MNEGGTDQQAHPKTSTYLAIAGILVVITVVEVGVFYVPGLKGFLAPMLLSLSAVKFVLVVMFFMHLKSDHKLFTVIFSIPLMIALAVGVALLFLFGVFF